MAATTEANRYVGKLLRRLGREYPHAACSLQFGNPLELLVATILSAQCTDKRVNLVTKDLFAKYGSVSDYALAKPAQLERDIRSTGFFRNKSKSIQGCCKVLVERYGGEVPRDLDTLVELPGIGRKTANVILGAAYGIASGVVVDTHVGRLSRRMGLTTEKNPAKIEQDLIEQVPKKQWVSLAHRMILHGRKHCTARKPNCNQCPLADICPRIGVEA